MKIGIVIGSVRQGSIGNSVAEVLLDAAEKYAQDKTDLSFEIIDLKDYPLPVFYKQRYNGDEPEYETKMALGAKLKEMDSYIFVIPEYNHSITAGLKNVLEYYYTEFNNKALGIVSYGKDLGVRSAQMLREIAAELRMADVRTHVTIDLFAEFDENRKFTPREFNIQRFENLFDDVVEWGQALEPIRNKKKLFYTIDTN